MLKRGLMWACMVLAGYGCGDEAAVAMSGAGGAEDDSPYKSAKDFSRLEDVCGLDTGYPGDVLCLKEPEEEEGFQLHLGPDNYDPVDIESFLLNPGVENNECFYVTTPNDKLETYYERLIHMRPVSHHMFLFLIEGTVYGAPEDYPQGWADCGGFTAGRVGALGGAEVPIVQYPANGVYAPENLGVGRAVPKRQLIKMEMHAINTTDDPVMRETWVNLWYKDRSEITEDVIDINILGGYLVATQPGDKEVMRVTVPITTPKRILNLYGHMHSHGVRFSAWRMRDGEATELLQDYDWFDPIVIMYDSITDNPKPDHSTLTAGGYTGILDFEAGDELYYECEVWNDSDVVLRFQNEAITGEMCNIFGEFIGNGSDLTVGMRPGAPVVVGKIGDDRDVGDAY